jgi:hypothetical protein
MERLVREHVAGNVDHNYRLWLLFALELFYRYWIERDSLDTLNEWVEQKRRGRQKDNSDRTRYSLVGV